MDSIKNADLRNLKPVKIEPKPISVENSITDQIKKALDERRRFFKGGKFIYLVDSKNYGKYMAFKSHSSRT